MNRVASCLGVREQWFTRGNYFVSFCDVHHTALSDFPWLLLCLRWVTSSPQTNDDSQAIGDCPLLSKQYFFSVPQNASLNLADTVPATTVSSVSPRETFFSFLLPLLWHLSGLILLKICRTSLGRWFHLTLLFSGFCPFLCKADFYPAGVLDRCRTPASRGRDSVPSKKLLLSGCTGCTLHVQLLQWAHKTLKWYLVCAVVIHTAHSTDCR